MSEFRNSALRFGVLNLETIQVGILILEILNFNKGNSYLGNLLVE